MPSTPQPVLGLVLAGGLSRRMGGGDKGMFLLQGRPLFTHVIERLRPQVDAIVLNANGDPARLASTALAVVPDDIAGYPGPLAGIVAGLDYAADRDFEWVVSVPADTPFLPHDLVPRLAAARAAQTMAVAASGGRVHPVVALWPVSMRRKLRDMVTAGLRKIGIATQDAAIVDWPDQPVDPFFNVNTPEDLAASITML